MSRIAAIVLAAGTSARMGPENKLLADLAGEPVLRRTVSNVLTSRARPVIVVTGHDAAPVGEALVGLAVSLVHNDRFAEGMATSLAAGVAAVPADADGALVCLGDMPLVQGQVMDAVIDVYAPDDGHSIAVPVHAGRRGHPVLWGRRYFTALQQLTGDAGARSLLGANAGQVVEVDIGDDTIFADADTPQALGRLRSGLCS